MNRAAAVMTLALASHALTACIPMREQNQSLGTSRVEASVALQRMRDDPKPLSRPVVVLNGYHGLPSIANRLASKLSFATTGKRSDFLAISYTFGTNMDAMTSQVIREVEARWPCKDPDQTTEVDVVAISMGGVIARWAALQPTDRIRSGADPKLLTPPASGKRLRIARLFTLGTPHRGAVMADSISLDAASRDMRSGSSFLATLDKNFEARAYELICYAQMRDLITGATRSAPPGCTPIWTSGAFFFSHLDLPDNPVFLADVAHHLRVESPTLSPSEAPPTD